MANPDILADGSITFSSDGSFTVFSSPLSVRGDFGLEFSIDASNTAIVQRIGVWPPEVIPGPATVHSFGFARSAGSSNSTMYAQSAPNNTAVGVVNVAVTGAANDRFSIVRRGDVVSLYRNYVNNLSEPLLIATADRDAYKMGIIQDWGLEGGTVIIKKARLSSDVASYLYQASDQVTDFGSTQSSLAVRVRQVSSVVGAGSYAQATI